MQTYKKQRLEIVVERALAPLVLGEVERAGARCFVVAPASGGRTAAGGWDAEVPGSGLGGVAISVVADRALCQTLAERLLPQLADNAAILLLSEVEVLRESYF